MNFKEQIERQTTTFILEAFKSKSLTLLYKYLKNNKYYTTKIFDILSKEYNINWDILPDSLVLKTEGNLQILTLLPNTLYFWIVRESKTADIPRRKKGRDVVIRTDIPPGLAAVTLGRAFITERNKKAFKKIDDVKTYCSEVYSVDIEKALEISRTKNTPRENELTKLQRAVLFDKKYWVHCRKKIEAIQFFNWVSLFDEQFKSVIHNWDIWKEETCYSVALKKRTNIDDIEKRHGFDQIIIRAKDVLK